MNEGESGATKQVREQEDKAKQRDNDGDKDDHLRLRLDLNLDVEVQLKAKIRGDITLGLLYVFFLLPFSFFFSL